MKGEAIVFGALTALALAGAARGGVNRKGSRSQRFMYRVDEETQEPWDPEDEPPDPETESLPPEAVDLADDDDLFEFLGLNVDALPALARDRLPAWLRAAVGFYKEVDWGPYNTPEPGTHAPRYYESDWEVDDYSTGVQSKKAIWFMRGDQRLLLSGAKVDLVTPWPEDAKRLVLAIFLLKKNRSRLRYGREDARTKTELKAFQAEVDRRKRVIQQILARALDLPHLELEFGDL